jgi:hypothetical protein
MPESYGGYSNKARVWFSYSVGGVGQTTTSVPMSVTSYLQMDGSSSSNGTYAQSYSGYWGSSTFNTNWSMAPNQSRAIASASYTITLTDSAQTFYFESTGRTFHGAVGHAITLTVPARFAVAPSGLTATRVSDTQQNLSWTRNSTYTSVVVQRSTDNATWVEVGRPTGNAASFSDTTTVANERYYYRVAGIGGSGQSLFSNTFGPLYTAPNPPTSVTATKSGVNIIVDATGLPPYATSYDVRDGATVVGTSVALPFTHSSPNPAVVHSYTVRGKVGSVEGAYSTVSNTVQLLTAPNAPTGLSPNGGVLPSGAAVRFEWQHNPVDTTAQTVYELRHRPVGGSFTTLSGTTAAFREVTLDVGVREWQVRTKGDSVDWSPWSAIATVDVITRPAVAVSQPSTWDQTLVTANWTFTQAQSRPQSAFRARLKNSVGEVIELREGSGAALTQPFTTRLLDGESYTIEVQAATSGVFSEFGVAGFTVAFVEPSAPTVSAVWNEASGSVELTVFVDNGEPPIPPAVSVSVDRSVDGGVTWEQAFVGLDADFSVSDGESLSFGETLYRVTAFAETGASSEVVASVVADSSALWLSGGTNFFRTVPLRLDVGVSIAASRDRTLQRYDGRSLGVAYAGEQVSRTVEVSGTFFYDEQVLVSELVSVAQLPDPLHLYRDPDGRRIYGVLSEVSLPRTSVDVWGYSFQLEESDK